MSQRKKYPALFVGLVVLLAVVLVFLSRILPCMIAPPFTGKDRAAYQRQLEWPVYIEESFEDDQIHDPAADWGLGYEFSDNYDFTRSLGNEQYYLGIEFFSPDSRITVKWLITEQPLEDFVLTAYFKPFELGFPERIDYGFIFNYQDDEIYYTVTISEGEKINVARTYQGNRKLIFSTKSTQEVIRPDEFNQLTLSFEGGQGLVFINEQYITQFKDTRIRQGQLGFVLEVPPGPSGFGTIHIDNVTLRVPGEASEGN